jgi:hypothetical protein
MTQLEGQTAAFNPGHSSIDGMAVVAAGVAGQAVMAKGQAQREQLRNSISITHHILTRR